MKAEIRRGTVKTYFVSEEMVQLWVDDVLVAQEEDGDAITDEARERRAILVAAADAINMADVLSVRTAGTNPDMNRDETIAEYDQIVTELLSHLGSMWIAFNSKDARAKRIRALVKAYKSRRAACFCGTPDPHITDGVNDGWVDAE